MPSFSTTLAHEVLPSTPSQYQRSFPVSGSRPQTSFGTAITRSCFPEPASTRTGVLQQPENPAASCRQTSSPESLLNAIIASLSAVAGTITRSLYKIGLEAVPHPLGSDSVPVLFCHSKFPSMSSASRPDLPK